MGERTLDSGRSRLIAAGSRAGLALFAALLLAAAAAAQGPAPRAAEIAFSRAPDAVVLGFAEVLGEVDGESREIAVRVHGDGRVEVEYPPGMRAAGRYRAQLAPPELDALVAAVAGRLATFDAPAARARRRGAEASKRAQPSAATGPDAQYYEAHDASTTVFTLELESYRAAAPEGPAQPAGPGGAAPPATLRDVKRRITWPGLYADARRHGDLAEIRALVEARDALRALTQRGDLVREP